MPEREEKRRHHDFVPFVRTQIEQSIPERFDQQARRYPDRPAIKFRDLGVTYRSLDELSNRIANAILRVTGEQEEPVLLLMDQGAAQIAAIIAALKAGKIYVPQDPASPVSGIRRVLKDSEAQLLICDRGNVAAAAALSRDKVPVIDIDDIGEDVGPIVRRQDLRPDRAAYIFYTSGSTGNPKGVVDSHRNVLHNVMRYTNQLSISAEDRLSLVQSCSFSGSVSNIFCALLNGAAVFPFDLRRAGAAELASWVRGEEITIFHSVPAIFERLLAGGPPFPSLRIVRLEGDQATRKHVELFQRHFDTRCRLANGLGATETGLVRQFFVDQSTDLPDGLVPIGYPIEDMEILVLDEAGRPVAIGQVGEIAVRSRFLATGYWRRSDLTQAAFRPDPADDRFRIYLTGDIGALAADGCLTYLGRKDFQIKIRGQRVDVGALEAALADVDGVDEAVVTAREDHSGAQQLVAYLAAGAVKAPTVSELRRELSKRFPPYALPSRYVLLDALPHDRNGKLLRRGLPAPGDDRPALEQRYVAPRTRLEKTLAECFGEILDLSEIGIDDDFFDLGGDSLKAVELGIILEQKLAMSVPSELFLEGFTVARLAKRILQETRTPNLVQLRNGSDVPLFLFHDYPGHVLAYRELARILESDVPVYAIQFNDEPDGYVVSPLLQDLAAYYVGAIRQIRTTGPYVIGGQCFGGVIAFEAAQQLRSLGETVSLLILIDTAYPAGRIRRVREFYAVRRHWRSISRLGLSEGLAYLATRLKNLVRFAASVAWRIALQTPGIRRLAGSQVPRSLQRPTDVHRIAEAGYSARPYDGRMVLVRASARAGHDGWNAVAARGLEVVCLDEPAEEFLDAQLTDPPHVAALARAVDRLLEGVRADT